MALCSNHSSRAFVSAALENPNRLGWLMGPTHFKYPKPGLPFALDNDGYINCKQGLPFNSKAWLEMLEKVKRSSLEPRWVLVPDSVGNRKETLEMWWEHWDSVSEYDWRLAFAVQDGMTEEDVPENADVVFVGGTTGWKWMTAKRWCRAFPRVHIGRVNGLRQLWLCQEYGAESVDGSGFLREGFHGKRANGLKAWLEIENDPQMCLL